MRLPEQEYPKRVAITERADKMLAMMKKQLKKSKAKIVCDLIEEHFNNL